MTQNAGASSPQQVAETLPGLLLSQLNWLNIATKPHSSGICEYPLFSDAHITGESADGFGPYQFLNTVFQISRGKSMRPSSYVWRFS
jgi:hypothetical protein